MKRFALFTLSILISLCGSATTFGRQSCAMNIVGTWKLETADATKQVLYQFTSDGTLTVLSPADASRNAAPEVLASAKYQLDDPKTPKSIKLTAVEGSKLFPEGTSRLEVVKYDDMSMTCTSAGAEPMRWVRVDPNRYFIILAARNDVFFDRSGPAFPMLIKVGGREVNINAVGTYSAAGKQAFGPVPAEEYRDFMRDSRNDAEVMLRLEINTAQYERGLKVLLEWERRVRENALLYSPKTQLNNVLLVKAVAESLNQCGGEIKVYQLNYLHPEDWISEKYSPPFLPFAYFKELRRLNESLHVRDEAFPKPGS